MQIDILPSGTLSFKQSKLSKRIATVPKDANSYTCNGVGQSSVDSY